MMKVTVFFFILTGIATIVVIVQIATGKATQKNGPLIDRADDPGGFWLSTATIIVLGLMFAWFGYHRLH